MEVLCRVPRKVVLPLSPDAMLHAVPLPTRPALLAPRAPVLAMSKSTSSPPKPIAAGALAFYFSFFFLSDVPPGPNVLNTPPDEFLSTVVDLSLNFFFVLPLTSPDAPVNDPMYESIFNTAIAFSLLFVGFAADGRKEAKDDSLLSNKFFPYLAAMPFATNLAYLAYLGADVGADVGATVGAAVGLAVGAALG